MKAKDPEPFIIMQSVDNIGFSHNITGLYIYKVQAHYHTHQLPTMMHDTNSRI